MVAIKNLEKKELVVSFDGSDYYLPSGSIVLVEPKLVEHLKERYPISFDFAAVVDKKTPVPKVKTTKTKSYIVGRSSPTQDMKVTRAGKQDNTFSDSETQGPGYYGSGIEEDTV